MYPHMQVVPRVHRICAYMMRTRISVDPRAASWSGARARIHGMHCTVLVRAQPMTSADTGDAWAGGAWRAASAFSCFRPLSIRNSRVSSGGKGFLILWESSWKSGVEVERLASWANSLADALLAPTNRKLRAGWVPMIC